MGILEVRCASQSNDNTLDNMAIDSRGCTDQVINDRVHVVHLFAGECWTNFLDRDSRLAYAALRLVEATVIVVSVHLIAREGRRVAPLESTLA